MIATDKAQILEVFSSIQGEGKYVGVKQVFVRFFKCNMHCVWCDTPHSIGDTSNRSKEYSLDELMGEVDDLFNDCHSVSLTGGEPLMQVSFMKEMLAQMKERNMPAYLETNGVFPEELASVINDIDMIAMDIKLPSSTGCKAYWDEHQAFINVAKEKELFIKTVISSNTAEEDVVKAIDLVANIDPSILFILQPNSFDMQNGVVEKCQEYQKLCAKVLTNVRVLPQVHRFMKLR